MEMGLSLAILNWVGLIVFAISGALLAVRHKMDLIGYILLGTATAIGGGTFRDLILGREVFWVVDATQLWGSIITSAITGIVVHETQNRLYKLSRQSYQTLLEWFDALGLSVFAITGALIAHNMGVNFVISITCGVMTATGGGLIRDIIANEKPFVTESELYASAAVVGAASVLLLLKVLPADLAIWIALLITFILRGGAILWGWRPPFSPK
ncbi:MAG: trimeric intracellular cation channel family protein [Alphaproteobacteria bacterium]